MDDDRLVNLTPLVPAFDGDNVFLNHGMLGRAGVLAGVSGVVLVFSSSFAASAEGCHETSWTTS